MVIKLEWLRGELQDAEDNGLSVFIMGHIPPGSLNCVSGKLFDVEKDSKFHVDWSERYRILIDRYSNIIKAQFFGHTHNDQFQVVRSYRDDSPIGTIYIVPSLTTLFF